jgi:hypothetical protein
MRRTRGIAAGFGLGLLACLMILSGCTKGLYDRNFLFALGLKSTAANSDSIRPLRKKRISWPGTRVESSRSGGPGPRRAADRVGQPGIRPNGDRPHLSPRRLYSYSPLSSAATRAVCSKT